MKRCFGLVASHDEKGILWIKTQDHGIKSGAIKSACPSKAVFFEYGLWWDKTGSFWMWVCVGGVPRVLVLSITLD